MEIKRRYHYIEQFLESKQSILVLGPRGTGKTYFLTRLLKKFPNSRRIDLLSQQEFLRYLNRPSHLYDEIMYAIENTETAVYIMIDEIQLLPQLLHEVHRCLHDFEKKVIFILTGSSARKLKRQDANLLAGRAIRFDFYSLTFNEIDIKTNFAMVMKWGSLPTVFVEKQEQIIIEYLKTYVGTYLQEEVQRESEIRKLDGFSRFLECAASDNGTAVNYSKIGRAANVNSDTVKEYFQILVDTLIVTKISAWTYSMRQQLQKAPKYYFFDNGILNALTGDLPSELKPSTYRYGKLFENLVVNELIRQNSLKRYDLNLFHYRTLRGQEIDIIVQKNPNSKPVAIEIKSGESPTIKKQSGIRNFQTIVPGAKCIVICQTPIAYVDGNIDVLPFQEGIEKALQIASQSD